MAKLSMQDLSYFGTSWYTIEKTGPSTAFALGAGYANARVERTDDGLFSAGIVERLDADGRVSDVILAFAGTQVAAADVLTDAALLLALPDAQAERAAAIYDELLADPRYAGAMIHVTGHSLGGLLTDYVLGHALVTYGAAATDARADFTAFGAPPFGDSIAAYFGLTPADFAGHVDGYAIENDALQLVGATHLGTRHLLATYHPYGDTILAAAINSAAAHHSSAYLGGFGLPGWLSAAQRAAVITAVVAEGGNILYDPTYGASGPVAQHIIGDAAANDLAGTAMDDVIQGGGGGDRLTGGGGADRFVFGAAPDTSLLAYDTILDFRGSDGDRIDLSPIDARADRLGNNAFTFVGSGAFTGAGQVAVHVVGGVSYVTGNLAGDAIPEFIIAVHTTEPLTAADLIL